MPLSKRAATIAAATALLGVACGLPTEVPLWDMTWSVPSKGSTINVNSLLPAGVTAAANRFTVTVDPINVTRVLGDDCTACAAANGQNVPKPAFTATGTGSATLPSGVTGATLTGSNLDVTITNNLGFDPLRPSAVARGWIRFVISSGATVIGRDSLNGAVAGLPAGTTTRSIALTGNVTSAGVSVVMTLDSPAGDAILMDASRTLTFRATANPVAASAAQVSLTNQAVNAEPTEVDLSDVDSAIRNRVLNGILTLAIVNPFAVTGNLTLSFTGGSAPVTKPVVLAAGSSTVEVAMSAAELQAILGSNVTLLITGTVNGTGVNVTPGQTVAVTTRLTLTLNSSED
jgi:hypothetical protein